MNKKNNRKGFTIVELVIVIAVIAILATVLVPTFGNVIEKAQVSSAIQEAKNTYTQYTVGLNYVENEKPAEKLLVKTSNGYYVEVTKGEVSQTAEEIEGHAAFTAHTLVIEKNGESVKKSCVGTCDKVVASEGVAAKPCSLTGN